MLQKGFIFEVDLEYRQLLHDAHQECPLAPEPLEIKESMLSNKAKQMLQGKRFKSPTKLTPNLYNKTKYVTHNRNLQFYLKQGLKFLKIHKVLQFQQALWLEPYINFSTDKRKKIQIHFRKRFFQASQ